MSPLFASVQADDQAYTWFLSQYKNWNKEKLTTQAQSFQDTFPTSVHADNVLYLSGYRLFKMGHFRSANRIWKTQIKGYPNSDKSLAARFALANGLLKQGQKKKGLDLLKRLVKRYPKSQEANQARLMLGSL